MTGKDLIIYILENDLVDKEMYKDGNIPGLMSVREAAVELGVGVATIKAYIKIGKLKHFFIGDGDGYVLSSQVQEVLHE